MHACCYSALPVDDHVWVLPKACTCRCRWHIEVKNHPQVFLLNIRFTNCHRFFCIPPYSKLDYSKTRFCFQFHPLIVIVLLSIHQSFTWKWVIFISQVWHLPVDNYCTALVEDSRWWKRLHLYGTWSNNGVSKCFVASCVMLRSLLRGVLQHSLYYWYSLGSAMGGALKSICMSLILA